MLQFGFQVALREGSSQEFFAAGKRDLIAA